MTQAQIKLLVFRLSEGYPGPLPLPLEEAPEPMFDLGVALLCPQCGSTYCHSEVAEGVCQARCNTCGCEFCQPKESVARRVVRGIMERQRRRKHLLDIPTVERKGHKRQAGGGHKAQSGVGNSRQMAHDRITTG